MYNSFLWIRNKLKLDDDFIYFLNSEITVYENRANMIDRAQTKLIKDNIKERSAENLGKIFKDYIDQANLDTAPKLYTIIHLVLKLMSPSKRKEMSKFVRIDDLSFLPGIKNDMDEKLFCDFLVFYAQYLDELLNCEDGVAAVYSGLVNVDGYLRDNVYKQEDCSLIQRSSKILFSIIKILETFVRLDKYFYIEPKTSRIEGNMIGTLLYDINKLYSFLEQSTTYTEQIIFEIDESFATCLYEQYSLFIRYTQRLQKLFKKLEEFTEFYALDLPDLHLIDVEKNRKIEKFMLEIKKGLKTTINKSEYDKTDLYVPLKVNHTLDTNWELLRQSFFEEGFEGSRRAETEVFKFDEDLPGDESFGMIESDRGGRYGGNASFDGGDLARIARNGLGTVRNSWGGFEGNIGKGGKKRGRRELVKRSKVFGKRMKSVGGSESELGMMMKKGAPEVVKLDVGDDGSEEGVSEGGKEQAKAKRLEKGGLEVAKPGVDAKEEIFEI